MVLAKARMMNDAKDLLTPDLNKESDIVIAVMGPTGAGKSTFIDTATQQTGRRAGHGLASFTEQVQATRISHPLDSSKSVVFVDTPGFDDTTKPDTEILKLIARWLEETYKSKIKLRGIIYVHRISDNRMSGSPLRNLHMFGSLCGDKATPNVVLITTMWNSRLKGAAGDQREEELKTKFWKPMLALGSEMIRFEGDYDSAWGIVNHILGLRPPPPLLLQEELVDLHRVLRETEAGKLLYSELQQMLDEQRDTFRRLRDEARKQADPVITKSLTTKIDDIQKGLNIVLRQMDEMKIPLSRRLLSIFHRKKSLAHPVKIPELDNDVQ